MWVLFIFADIFCVFYMGSGIYLTHTHTHTHAHITHSPINHHHQHQQNSLFQILDDMMDGGKILIFTATKRTADSLTRELRSAQYPARAIHGDKSQRERDWVLAEFRTGRSPLMIATDVASRGLGKETITLD